LERKSRKSKNNKNTTHGISFNEIYLNFKIP